MAVELRLTSNKDQSISDAITLLNSKGTIEIVSNETISSNLDIPSGVTLVGLGGVLTVASGITLGLDGKAQGYDLLLGNLSDAGRLALVSQFGVDARIFGFEGSNSASDNLNAWISAWVATSNYAIGTHEGARLQIPGGWYSVNPFDSKDYTVLGGVSSSAASSIKLIEGSGIRRTQLRAPTNTNAKFFLWDNFNQSRATDLGFGAASQSSWPSDTPLFSLEQSYNARMDNIYCRNDYGDGIHVDAGQQQVWIQCESENAGNWAWTIEDLLCGAFIGCSGEQSTGGFRLKSGSSDLRTGTIGNVYITPYLENTTTGMKFEGAGGNIVLGGYHSGTTAFSFDAGSAQNFVLGSGIRSAVSMASTSYLNEYRQNIIRDAGEILDPGHLNDVTPIAENALAWSPEAGISGTSLVSETNPAANDTASNATSTAGTCSDIPEAAACVTGTGVRHLRLVGNGYLHRHIMPSAVLSAGTIYYAYISVLQEHGAYGQLYFYAQDYAGTNKYYDFETGEFTSSNGTGIALPVVPGKLCNFKIRLDYKNPTAGGTVSGRLRMDLYAARSTTQAHRLFHIDVSASPNMRRQYRRSSTSVGYGGHIEYAFASLPSAAYFSTGTKVWDTTNTRYVYSDGTNWKTAAGATAT